MKTLVKLCLLTCLAASCCLAAEPKIQWDAKDLLLSRRPPYKYITPEPYTRPAAGQPDPGVNFMIGLEMSDAPPAVADRLLPRNARLTGKIADPPADAAAGRVWLEDNYGRVLDEAALKGPDFAFELDASRCLKMGLYLKAELKNADKLAWSGSVPLRMAPPEEDPWRDFLLGVYNTGAKPGTGELFRQVGIGHRAIQTTNQPAYIAQDDLRFHASNILYSLLGFYHRDLARWREVKAAQAASKGPIELSRHRCLSDPKEQKFITDILTGAAMIHGPYQPLEYSIGDEIGIGNMAGPADLCACKYCMRRYRAWLKERYGSVEKLNEQWATQYRDFEAVQMWSTWQAMERFNDAKAPANFSPWADRLEFMDTVLADAVKLGSDTIRKIDPKAMTNISGVQQPAAWSFDHWKLSRAVNCMTPYDIGEGPDVLMSFYNDGADGKVIDPGFGGDCEGLWRTFIRGGDMAQQWDSVEPRYSNLIDPDKKELTNFGKKVKEFADWVHSGPGRLRNASLRYRDPVAILYSQPSLRANWILEIVNRPDAPDTGDKWAIRDSHSVRQKEMYFRVRVSWAMWLRDIGIWPKWVDSSQVDEGYLVKNEYKVLVLPRAVAMSDKTAEQIRKFVEAGGTVIADSLPGIMDEHCRIRQDGKKGALDDLFGVKRGDWKKWDTAKFGKDDAGLRLHGDLPFHPFERTLAATTGKPELTMAPTTAAREAASRAGESAEPATVAVHRQVGKGRALYLNFNLEEYFLHRLEPTHMVASARSWLRDTTQTLPVIPPASVNDPTTAAVDIPHPVGHDVRSYRNGRGWLVGVMMNPTMMVSELGGIESRFENIEDNPFLKQHEAHLDYQGKHAYDLVAGGPVQTRSAGLLKFTSKPREGRFYAFWPFEIQDVSAKAEVTEDRLVKVEGKLTTSAPMEDETLVVHLRAIRSDGAEQPAYTRTIDVKKNAFAAEFPLGLNEHGDWKLVLREPCSGKKAELALKLP